MDEYSDYIYIGPMILGGIASVLAAAWKFLGIGQLEFRKARWIRFGLARRIRGVVSEGELSGIEEEIDNILRAERRKAEARDENAVDAATLNVERTAWKT
jgi:hypothetical protein